MRLLAAIALLGLSAAAQAEAPPMPIGLWQNPKGTILVRTRACGQLLCGNIIWAAPAALADAREAGVTSLIGTELLVDYRPKGTGHWTGQVYVPDQGRRFYSTIDQTSANSLRIAGCILGGLICKHQDWTRR
jgi:uncharacterized protein (DUF2147 family)